VLKERPAIRFGGAKLRFRFIQERARFVEEVDI
jgi:hypothetical protein